MEYRILPNSDMQFGVIGIGSGSVHASDEKETVELIDLAETQGVNLIDMATSYPEPWDHYGLALRGRRDKFYLQAHLGITYASGEYARDYSLDGARRSFEHQLGATGSDYMDIAVFHCIDPLSDFNKLMDGGLFDYAVGLKRAGVIRKLGFASHSVDTAYRFIDTGEIDIFMFSINAAYDLDPAQNDPHGNDNSPTLSQDRAGLYQECMKRGIGITAMKTYGGGRLLDAGRSPLGRAMTIPQCIQYVLDRPAVLACMIGIRNKKDLEEALAYCSASREERDYCFIAGLQPKEMMGSCVYCNHCMPCPQGINIGQTHKFLDLYLAGDQMAREHYRAMDKNADDCIRCGLCESRCPFGVDVRAKMQGAVEAMG